MVVDRESGLGENASMNHKTRSQVGVPEGFEPSKWNDWTWQLRASLKEKDQLSSSLSLTAEELSYFTDGVLPFKVQTTPYYMRLVTKLSPESGLRKIFMPDGREHQHGHQAMLDPLGENAHRPHPRIIHRYTDRVLFLVTDHCAVYCRYCTRKHFTGKEQAFPSQEEYEGALRYISTHPEVKEVILSGGDPLSLSDGRLEKVLRDLRAIEHVEIIRIGTRMPVVCPMRVTIELVEKLKPFHPVFIMTHFNHPDEVTEEAAQALTLLVDNGFPVLNQMVLLNGVNNHERIVATLSRKLLFLRVKPYYMFQCDPSLGTDHLRTSIDNSLKIQRALWGRLSGLALPALSMDIPDGGGKAPLVPNFEIERMGRERKYRGWDGITSIYVSPPEDEIQDPPDIEKFRAPFLED